MVDDAEATAFNNQSFSLIKLNNGTILYLREVNKFLALVCILREDNFDKQGTNFFGTIIYINDMYIYFINIVIICYISGVIDYNFLCFREAITRVFELRSKNQAVAEPTPNENTLENQNSSPPIIMNGTLNSSESSSNRAKNSLIDT